MKTNGLINGFVSDMVSVVMVGATGAVGTEVVKMLAQYTEVSKITLLGRRQLEGVRSDKVSQHVVDVLNIDSYQHLLGGHTSAICTLGVGQPSKVSRGQFTRVDKAAPLAFAKACKASGVRHFQLLSSVGTSANSASFFLRSKGELEAGLEALGFDSLSIFQPSMILTPHNRYGFSQALTLAVWPVLSAVLLGPLEKYKGIKVNELGQAIAFNTLQAPSSEKPLSEEHQITRRLQWRDFKAILANA